VRLDEQAASGDLHALKDMMFRPDNPLGDQERARKASTSHSSTD
jgi:hypothetical protein